jgi:hypothetical protein
VKNLLTRIFFPLNKDVQSSSIFAFLKVVNAEQFKLPRELESRESLPFSWKWSDERQQDDLDHAPRNCSVCHKNSRGVPAVGCDFCPCIFHLDCLDPPLCDVPKVLSPTDEVF